MDNGNAFATAEERALKEFPDDRAGCGECQRILHDWFDRLLAAGNDLNKFRSSIADGIRVLTNIRLAMCPVVIDDDKYTNYRIWAWPNEGAIRNPPNNWMGRSPARVDELDDALANYLKRPWLQHDIIDASAINALLFTELAEFSEQVRSGAVTGVPNWSYVFSGGNIFAQLWLKLAGSIVGFLAKWVILPAISAGLIVYGYEQGAIITIGIWTLYIIYRILTIPARWRLRKARRNASVKSDEIIRAMLNAWGSARGRTINPTRLKELVLAAEERGAVFRPVLHTLIDRAIKRDPTALVTE